MAIVKRRPRPAPEPQQQAQPPLIAWVAWGDSEAVEIVKAPDGRLWPIPRRALQ